jgi:CubicO group peptidase (beta-lactamase class C family)
MAQFKRVISTALKGLLAVVLVVAALPAVTGNQYIYRAFRATYLMGHTTANIDDAPVFDQRIVKAGTPQPWPVSPVYNQTPLPADLVAWHEQFGTAAWLVVHDGQVLQERYFAPYNAESRTNSFSMAKTVTTMLAGAAVADGYLLSFDEPVSDFIQEWVRDPRGGKATFAQFSAMSAGHNWTESYYLPLNPTAELYYGDQAEAQVLAAGFERDPGKEYEYNSAGTQVLAVALRRALQRKNPELTLAQYFSEKFWVPLGMEHDAIWTVDRPDGMEKAFCCIYATARDYAKLGQLLLQGGQWQGKQLLDAGFIARMSLPDLQPFYGHSLWMDHAYKHPFYLFQGHLGQYIIVVPSAKLVVVRLGQTRDKDRAGEMLPKEIYRYVDAAVEAARQAMPAAAPMAAPVAAPTAAVTPAPAG